MIQGLESGKIKSLWNQPGSGLAKVVLVALGAGGLITLYKLLPSLITLAENTLYFGTLLAAIGAVTYLLMDKRFRRLISVGYFMLMRKITSAVIQLDPIAILEDRLGKMKKSIAQIKENMGKMKGHINKTKKQIDARTAEFEETLKMAKVYENKGNREAAIVELRQSDRLKMFVERLTKIYNDSQKWYNSLSKLSQMAELNVLDTEREINMQRDIYELVKRQHKVFKSVMSILEGDPDELALYNEALGFIITDIEERMGEMEHIIDGSTGLLNKFEAQQDLTAMKGSELMEQYEKLGIEGIFSKFNERPIITMENDRPTIQISKTQFQYNTIDANFEQLPSSTNLAIQRKYF
jgi:archaellum component FlaC